MSWFCIDDGMLDHEKWIRAIRDGGDAALHLWLRMGTWSARHLTDGVIPAHVADSLPGPRGGKTRARALRALSDASLVHRRDDGELTLHDYLDYNPSRADVLAERQRKRRNKQDQRDRESVTGDDAPSVDGDRGVPSPPIPSPLRTLSLPARGRAPDPEPELPPPWGPPPAPTPAPTPAPAASRFEGGPEPEPGAVEWLPDDFTADEALYADGVAAGCTKAGIDEFVGYWRGRKLGGQWRSPSAFVRAKLASIRDREAKARTAARSPGDRRSGPTEAEPLIDLDLRFIDGNIKRFIADHGLGEWGVVVRQWINEATRNGQRLTRTEADKALRRWLKARVANSSGAKRKDTAR